MTEKDIPAVSSIIARNFNEIMAKDHSADVIERFRDHNTNDELAKQMEWKEIFVVTDKDAVIATGAIADFSSNEDPKYSISNFYVIPEMHKKGIGRNLFLFLKEKVQMKNVHTLHVPSSRNAVGFYSKVGFIADKEQPDEKDEITWMTMSV